METHMITRSDCILLLSDLKNRGVDTSEYLTRVLQNKELDIDCLKFINEHRQLDVTSFYKKLRRSYNKKKSKLYGNIVKENRDPLEAPTVLASLLLQILLFSKEAGNRQLFLRHSRANEINKVLSIYFSDFDLTNCIKLLDLIKVDLKVVETFYR